MFLYYSYKSRIYTYNYSFVQEVRALSASVSIIPCLSCKIHVCNDINKILINVRIT